MTDITFKRYWHIHKTKHITNTSPKHLPYNVLCCTSVVAIAVFVGLFKCFAFACNWWAVCWILFPNLCAWFSDLIRLLLLLLPPPPPLLLHPLPHLLLPPPARPSLFSLCLCLSVLSRACFRLCTISFNSLLYCLVLPFLVGPLLLWPALLLCTCLPLWAGHFYRVLYCLVLAALCGTATL